MKSKKLKLLAGVVLCLFIALGGGFLFFKPQLKSLLKDQAPVWQLEVKLFPKNAAAYDRLAQALMRKPEYQEAIKQYAEILAFDPGWKTIDPAKAKDIQAKITELVSYYEVAIRLNPKFFRGHEHFAMLCEEMGHKAKACEYYIKASQLNPYQAETHLRLARLFADLGDYAQSVLAYNQLLTIFPKDEEVYVKVVDDLSAQIAQHPDEEGFKIARREAVEKFTKLINSKTASDTSYAYLGYILMKMGDFQRAVSAYKIAVDLNPNNVRSLYNLANLYRFGGRVQEAKDLYSQAMKADANFADAYAGLGAIYFDEGNSAQAIEMFQQAIAKQPAEGNFYFQLGYIMEKAGSLNEAVLNYQKAAELVPQNAEIRYNLGNVLLTLKKVDEAKASYQQVVTLNPNHLNAYVNLCLLTFEQKALKEAAQFCSEAVLLGYDLPESIQNVLNQVEK